jgi:hypothetical protein
MFTARQICGTYDISDCSAELRTDTTFRVQQNSAHHHGLSPFASLPVNMVDFFPVDYMHQTCLGVMKRMIVCWLSGPTPVKLSSFQISDINRQIQGFKSILTTEFTRKLRPLSDYKYWKATEFRMFLVYAGFFVLRNNMQHNFFEHFMCLSVAINILLSTSLSQKDEYKTFAHELLIYFVQTSRRLYGDQFLVYNVHSLIHLRREVELFGKLDNSSAFIFENFMQRLKRMVRSGRNPLVQVSQRIKEFNAFGSYCYRVPSYDTQLRLFPTSSPNNCAVLSDGCCCQVVSCVGENVACIIFKHTEPVYSRPCDSRVLGVFKARLKSGKMKVLSGELLASKALCHTNYMHEYIVFIKLLHLV